jgi:hypothetical protein
MAGLVTAAAQEWEAYDLFGGETYGEKTGSTLKVRSVQEGLVFSGFANNRSAGYVIESTNLGLNGKKQIKLEITGIEDADKFSSVKLLKLELNNTPVKPQNIRDRNRNDENFLNARDGEYIFDIEQIANILKINFLFFDCTVRNLSVKMFVR